MLKTNISQQQDEFPPYTIQWIEKPIEKMPDPYDDKDKIIYMVNCRRVFRIW